MTSLLGQSLETDFRPPLPFEDKLALLASELVGEMGNTLETNDVERSSGLSSSTLSMSLLKRVCLRY